MNLSFVLALLFTGGVVGASGFQPPIQLIAQPLGGGQASLRWSNATTTTVDIYRDGAVVGNAPSVHGPPPPTTTLADQPTGSHVYKVCEPGGRCSNTVTINVT